MVYRTTMRHAASHTHKYSVTVCSVLNSFVIQHPLRENSWPVENQENTLLTVSRISIVLLLPVDDIGDSNNEGGKDPYHEDHELRDIIWCAPTEDKHTKGMHSNSLSPTFPRDKEKDYKIDYGNGPRTCNRTPESATRKLKKQRQLRVAPEKNSRHCHTNNPNLLDRSLCRAKVSFRDGLRVQMVNISRHFIFGSNTHLYQLRTPSAIHLMIGRFPKSQGYDIRFLADKIARDSTDQVLV